nr:3'(2'),5'-bisphosphate nucleotidase CysQ [Nitratireductor sp.]
MAASDHQTRAAPGDLALLHDAANEAGNIALRYYRAANSVWMKQGNSPVSQADIEVDNYLRETLLKARPGYGWLSEETVDDPVRMERDYVFVVDPIDGTRGFLDGNPHWCVCLSVVKEGRPVASVVHCPALNRTFSAEAGK